MSTLVAGILLVSALWPILLVRCQNNSANSTRGLEAPPRFPSDANLALIGMERFDKVRLTEGNYERTFDRNMHVNWYAAGVKALMGKLGRELYGRLANGERRLLAQCLDRVEDRKDLVQSAKCLSTARKAHLRRLNGEEESRQAEGGKAKKSRDRRNFVRKKREIAPASPPVDRSPFAEWTQRLRRFRQKERKQSGDVKRSKWALDRESLSPKFQVKQAESLEKLPSEKDRSAIIRVSNLISKMAGKEGNDSASGAKWSRMYESLVRLKRANDRRRESPGAAVYDLRMHDLVLGSKEPSLSPQEKKSAGGLLQMGISLLNRLRNESSQRASNFKFMSPQFAPLMPDGKASAANKSFLSPTVFALYETQPESGRPQSALDIISSAPEALKATGLNKEDREALLQALMEVSGSIGHVQEAMELLKALNFFEIEPDISEANDRILKAYKKMESTFDAEQEREIEHEGWTFLRQRQFDQLCSDQHANLSESGVEMDSFARLDRRGREEAVWRRIERIARNIPDQMADKLDKRRMANTARLHLDDRTRRRHRRQTVKQAQEVSWLSVMKPVILQPFMFTPVYGLSVLGPLILSPNIFSPLILAPSVLSPYVLSPSAPMPLILSPYVFGPFILSPMALTPFILTPYVLSPNVLNPYALSPLILSPTVLSPDILSPQVLGGGILSPTVGSPAVLTDSYLMASVLSPSVLS